MYETKVVNPSDEIEYGPNNPFFNNYKDLKNQMISVHGIEGVRW